jgi:biotin transport system substrate-specific component
VTSGSRTQSIVLIGLCVALLAIGAFITVPFGPVPFTLQTMMLVLTICLLTPRCALAAVTAYLLLGALGLPVFSGMRGGIAVLLGPTGGFLMGFLLATVIIAIFKSNFMSATACQKHPWLPLLTDVMCAVVLTVVSYALGSAWYAFSAHVDLTAAALVTIVPFVLPDILKALAAIICVQSVRTVLTLRVPERRIR